MKWHHKKNEKRNHKPKGDITNVRLVSSLYKGLLKCNINSKVLFLNGENSE